MAARLRSDLSSPAARRLASREQTRDTQEQINGSKKQSNSLSRDYRTVRTSLAAAPPAVLAFEPVRSLRHWRIYEATRVHIATLRRGGLAARSAGPAI
jgi:hypothetical protein